MYFDWYLHKNLSQIKSTNLFVYRSSDKFFSTKLKRLVSFQPRMKLSSRTHYSERMCYNINCVRMRNSDSSSSFWHPIAITFRHLFTAWKSIIHATRNCNICSAETSEQRPGIGDWSLIIRFFTHAPNTLMFLSFADTRCCSVHFQVQPTVRVDQNPTIVPLQQ